MLNQDYRDMLLLLLDNKVEFVLVGAYALAAHGYPRATSDIDIFIKPASDNAARLLDVLTLFGAPIENISVADFQKVGTIFQIGVKPRRIDLITKIDGVSFDEIMQDVESIELEGLKLPVISKQALIKNKSATGRDKDRLDVETLKNI